MKTPSSLVPSVLLLFLISAAFAQTYLRNSPGTLYCCSCRASSCPAIDVLINVPTQGNGNQIFFYHSSSATYARIIVRVDAINVQNSTGPVEAYSQFTLRRCGVETALLGSPACYSSTSCTTTYSVCRWSPNTVYEIEVLSDSDYEVLVTEEGTHFWLTRSLTEVINPTPLTPLSGSNREVRTNMAANTYLFYTLSNYDPAENLIVKYVVEFVVRVIFQVDEGVSRW